MPDTSFLSVHPVLAVPDLQEAFAYYRDRLGFTVAWEWGQPANRGGVVRDGIELQLLSDPGMRPAAPGQLYFHIQGVEAYYRACKEAGANLTSTLEEQPWGMHDFRLLDPGGNQLGFGETLGS